MINFREIKDKAERLYSKFLSSVITGNNFFPQEFPTGKISQEFHIFYNEVNQLIENSKEKLGYGYTVLLETRKTRKNGEQSEPKKIIIETKLDYLKIIKKEKEFKKFTQNIELIILKIPELKNWISNYPLEVIKQDGKWEDLLKVCQYFQQNPQPNLYIRELPIKVHTKFIEQNKGIIRQLLEAILPTEILQSVNDKTQKLFEQRFCLKYEEPTIRLRILDKKLQKYYNFPIVDFSTPISEFKKLNFKDHHFFITENLMNFLTLPQLDNSFAIWGKGYAIQSLKSVSWLANCKIYYWGDLDADGFKILSQWRSYFPETISMMMNQKTFQDFAQFCVDNPTASLENLPNLIPEEELLYSYLCTYKKRLEQERISQDFVNQYLQELLQ